MAHKLSLRWVVFTDEYQNLWVFDLHERRQVGVYDRPERRMSACLVLTENEKRLALEALVDSYELTAKSTEETRSFVAKVRGLVDSHLTEDHANRHF